MNWLTDILGNLSKPLVRATNPPYPGQRKKRVDDAKGQIVNNLLNLIEQAKEKDLPLTWLTKEFEKL